MVRQKRQGKMGDQAGKVSETEASRATRLECKVPNCRGESAVDSLACEKHSCPSAGKAQFIKAAALSTLVSMICCVVRPPYKV